jgi:hypothetical protein
MSIMPIGLQMQVMVGYMACGTAIFDTFFLDATNAGLRAGSAVRADSGADRGSRVAAEAPGPDFTSPDIRDRQRAQMQRYRELAAQLDARSTHKSHRTWLP